MWLFVGTPSTWPFPMSYVPNFRIPYYLIFFSVCSPGLPFLPVPINSISYLSIPFYTLSPSPVVPPLTTPLTLHLYCPIYLLPIYYSYPPRLSFLSLSAFSIRTLLLCLCCIIFVHNRTFLLLFPSITQAGFDRK